MASSIPASQIVSVVPSTLSAGGAPLSLNSVFLTNNTNVPIGQVLSFATAAAVSAYFGPASNEYSLALIYFAGFTGGTQLPSALMFFQYASSAVSAYSRASAQLTLAQIQAIIPAVFTGSIATTTLTVTAVASGTITPGMILTGTSVTANTRIVAQLTGSTPGGTGTYSVSISGTTSSTTITGAYDMSISIDGTPVTCSTINLSSASSFSAAATAIGTALSLSGGQTCTYSSLFGVFIITSGTTGASSSVGIATGLLGTTLGFGAAATISPGAAAMTEAGAMNTIVGITQNFAPFMTVWEPNLASKKNFAAWTVGQNSRYMYVAWDSDTAAITANNTTSFGPYIASIAASGIVCIGGDTAVATQLGVTLASLVQSHAAFVCGMTAAINFNATQGRITYAGKGQSGLQYAVNNVTSAVNLLANGYNFYGVYATATQQFIQFQNGAMAGAWAWIDPYINQIYFNSQFQQVGMQLFATTNSIPFNDKGYSLVRAAFAPVATQMLNFGAAQPNVPLSPAQQAEINNVAGLSIANTLQTVGWYLLIPPATAQQRATRGPIQPVFYYNDGGSIQTINLASIDVQ